MSIPVGYYIYNCSIPPIKIHKLNLAVNPTAYRDQVLLKQYPWETATTIANAQTAKKQIFGPEVL